MEFCKAFNAQTVSETGTVIPVVITVYEDRSFTFITKTPPAAVLIRQALGIDKGSWRAEPHQGGDALRGAGARYRANARCKTSTRTTSSRPSKIIAGTARSMGVEVQS